MAARISKADFDEKVLKSKLPVIVDFYSDSCVACKKLAPVLGDIEDDYEDKLHVYKVNTNFDGELADDTAFRKRRRGLRQKGRRTKACRFEGVG